MTMLESDNAEFAFVQYFDFTPAYDNMDPVLNNMCLLWATEDEFDHFFSFDPSLSR